MELNNIVADIYTNKRLNAFANKLLGYLAPDIMGYLAEELLKNPEKTIEIHSRKKLFEYSKSFIYLSKNSKTSRFAIENEIFAHKPTGKERVLYGEGYDIEVLNDVLVEMEMEKLLKGKYPYQVKLFYETVESGSYKEVARETGIPLKSIYKSMCAFKQEVIKRYKSKF